MLISNFGHKRDEKASLTWPSVVGQVTEVDTKIDGDPDRAKYEFMPKVNYVIVVDSKLYDGKRINFGRGPIFNTQEAAEDFLKKFPPEAEVKVYYDPNNPHKAVLRKEVLGTKSGMVSGIVLILVMVGMICVLTNFLRLL